MNKILFLLTILFVMKIFAEIDENTCNIRNGEYIKAGNKTYYIETFFKANWYKAYEYCRNRGMFLVSIENHGEILALDNMFKRLGYSGGDKSFWTSGYILSNLWFQSKYDNFWFSTGNLINLTSKSWIPGEPSHGSNDYCINLENDNTIREFRLNDISCLEPIHFICEKVCD